MKNIKTGRKKLVEAWNAFLKVVDIYDGYASENGVEKDDRYWGDMEALNKEVDAATENTKTVKDIHEKWDKIVAVATKVLDGIDGLISERGDVDRYGKMSSVTKAKKVLGIKSKIV